MKFLQQMVNKKLNNITVKELLQYSNQYNISLTEKQARTLITIIKEKPIDIYNVEERRELIKKIAQVTDRETAKKINTLLQQLI